MGGENNKKFTCSCRPFHNLRTELSKNVQVKEPAQIYNTFWKFPLKLFQKL